MNISIILFIIICSLYFVINVYFKGDQKKKDSKFLKICFVIFFIVLFFRRPFSDLVNYIHYFRYISSFSMGQFFYMKFEFLYKLLNLVVGKIYFNEKFFITIVDIITLIGPYYFIKKYSNNYLISILLFLAIGTFYMQFFILRQALALSFILLSVRYISEKKFWKFMFFVFIAYLFHSSALIFAITYFASFFNEKNLNKKLLVWIVFLVMLYIFKERLSMLSFIGKYSNYIGSRYSNAGEGYGKLALYILLMLFSLLFYKRKIVNNRDQCIMFTMMLLCICIQIVSTNLAVMIRLANYFCMGFVILPANGLNNLTDSKTRLCFNLFTIFIIFFYLFFYNPIIGYETFFDI